jgi:hypothetical protein
MRLRQGAVLEMLRRVQAFLDKLATLGWLPESLARQRLDEVVERIAAHALEQLAGQRISQGETEKQRRLRHSLRHYYMRPIAVIAREHLREKPEFALLRLPPWNLRGVGLSAVARDMANTADIHIDLFVEGGLSREFVAELRAVADQLEASFVARGHAQAQRAGATQGLKAETTRAHALIQVIDSQLRPKLRVNDQLLREWEVAKHVQRVRTSHRETLADETSLPALPTATSSPALTLMA